MTTDKEQDYRKAEVHWKRQAEKKEQIINFINLMIEEFDIDKHTDLI